MPDLYDVQSTVNVYQLQITYNIMHFSIFCAPKVFQRFGIRVVKFFCTSFNHSLKIRLKFFSKLDYFQNTYLEVFDKMCY